MDNRERAREWLDENTTSYPASLLERLTALLDAKDAEIAAAEARGRNQALQSEQHRTDVNVAFEKGRDEGWVGAFAVAEVNFERLRDEGYEVEEMHSDRGEHGDAAVAGITARAFARAVDELRALQRGAGEKEMCEEFHNRTAEDDKP